MIDIGGGSTEIIQAGPDGLGAVVGLPLGASRLSTHVGADDPPTADQVAALRREADRIVAAAPDLELGETIAVGGTAYGVARVATGPGVGERLVDADGIALAVAISGRERSTQVAELFGLNPRRARILPAGAAILAALAARYGFDRIRASERGIREGLVRAILADPIAWRDRLGRFARSKLGLERRDRPAEGPPEGQAGHAAPRPADRSLEPGDLALAEDEVATDRRAPAGR